MRQTVIGILENSRAGKRAGRWARRQRIRMLASRGEFTPWIPDTIDERLLIGEISDFFRVPLAEVQRLHDEYRGLHDRHRYAERLGETKTLNFGEALILFVIMARFKPAGPIVEIGTYFGSSTRRILDARDHLGLENEVTCFDIVDNVSHFEPHEARLVLKDVTGDVTGGVLDALEPSLIYLDAHPYGLLESVISETIAHPSPCILAIHDCSFGLCNPVMALEKNDPGIGSMTGHWERHVLARIFGVQDVMSSRLDALETKTHSLRIFSTSHGLAVILPKALLKEPA